MLLADGRVAGNNPIVELVVAELADAILRFAVLKVALDFFLALNTRIGLIGFHGARRVGRGKYEGENEENEGDGEQEWSFHGFFLSVGSLIGGTIGSKISLTVNSIILQKLFSFILILVAMKLLYDGLFYSNLLLFFF